MIIRTSLHVTGRAERVCENALGCMAKRAGFRSFTRCAYDMYNVTKIDVACDRPPVCMCIVPSPIA